MAADRKPPESARPPAVALQVFVTPASVHVLPEDEPEELPEEEPLELPLDEPLELPLDEPLEDPDEDDPELDPDDVEEPEDEPLEPPEEDPELPPDDECPPLLLPLLPLLPPLEEAVPPSSFPKPEPEPEFAAQELARTAVVKQTMADARADWTSFMAAL